MINIIKQEITFDESLKQSIRDDYFYVKEQEKDDYEIDF